MVTYSQNDHCLLCNWIKWTLTESDVNKYPACTVHAQTTHSSMCQYTSVHKAIDRLRLNSCQTRSKTYCLLFLCVPSNGLWNECVRLTHISNRNGTHICVANSDFGLSSAATIPNNNKWLYRHTPTTSKNLPKLIIMFGYRWPSPLVDDTCFGVCVEYQYRNRNFVDLCCEMTRHVCPGPQIDVDDDD